MTKQDVVRQVTARTGGDPPTSRLIIESFFKIVKSALTEGEPVYVRKFGSFMLKRRAAKVGRNIHQNTAMTLAAHMIPLFKPSAEFADQIRAQVVPAIPGKAAL